MGFATHLCFTTQLHGIDVIKLQLDSFCSRRKKINKMKSIPDNFISFYLGKYTNLSASKSMLLIEVMHRKSTMLELVFWLL